MVNTCIFEQQFVPVPGREIKTITQSIGNRLECINNNINQKNAILINILSNLVIDFKDLRKQYRKLTPVYIKLTVIPILQRLFTKKDRNINYIIEHLISQYLEPWINGYQGPTDDNSGGEKDTLRFPSVPTHKPIIQLPIKKSIVLPRTKKYLKYKIDYYNK